MEATLMSAQATSNVFIEKNSDFNQPTNGPSDHVATDSTYQPSDVLLSISSVFPFDLFPDTITIEENKVKIIFNHFSFSYRVHGVLIRDITDIVVDIHLFLATLTMVDSSNYRFPIEIKVFNLQISDALRARTIILDLIAQQRQRINLSGVPFQS